ncbi:signal peptidase II [Celeribacter sp.]|uniref:signal peptidase II n=1 Tax=Celeribacter sp. TaxID=1890673 RepID=UPI003A912A68
MRLAIWIATVSFVIDQLSKWVVVHALNLRSVGEIDVFAPYLVFRMAWNRGINFGLFAEHVALLRWGWVALAVGVSLWVLSWVRRENLSALGQISAGLLVGGALGNALDRVIYGAVADFLNMGCCGIENPYSFNVADISIFAGAFGLILFTGKDEKRA